MKILTLINLELGTKQNNPVVINDIQSKGRQKQKKWQKNEIQRPQGKKITSLHAKILNNNITIPWKPMITKITIPD